MHLSWKSSRRALGAALLALALALMLTACGGGSSNKSGSVAAASTTHSGATAPPAAVGRQRFAHLRECLEKNGINLPRNLGLGGILGLGRRLPAGVSRAEFEGVMKKCGGAPRLRGGTRGFGVARSPAFQAALKRFTACMRANGVNLPEANTSGKGPIFDTKGLNTASPAFRAASAKCSIQLRSAFQRPGGSPAPAG